MSYYFKEKRKKNLGGGFSSNLYVIFIFHWNCATPKIKYGNILSFLSAGLTSHIIILQEIKKKNKFGRSLSKLNRIKID